MVNLTMEHKATISKTPYPYQVPLIKEVCDELKKNDRCVFPPACGTGKTLMSWFVAKKLKAKRIDFVVSGWVAFKSDAKLLGI